MKANYIKLEFKGNRRVFYYNEMEYPIQKNDYIVVETDKGEDMGKVTAVLENLCESCPEISDLQIFRKASQRDWTYFHQNGDKEKEALATCLKMVKDLKLEMKLMDVEYQLDRKKVTFFYTADERVDFRELVRQLASVFRTRIEMRQIGVRDEAKRLSGCGSCGLPLCCGTFIETFEPVNTQFAKEQNLPMNPSKLSGQCGKLKCCLRYEHGYYMEELAAYPAVGEPVAKDGKKGFIEKIDIIAQMVTCVMENNSREDFTKSEVITMRENAKKMGLDRMKAVSTEILDGDASDLDKIEDK